MGAACCVAVKDKTIPDGSSGELLRRNIQFSPSWNFRWDHRGRVAGEDTTRNWFPDGLGHDEGLDDKNESYSSDYGSPENIGRVMDQTHPISNGITSNDSTSISDQSISRNLSINKNMEQVKEPMEFHTVAHPSPAKLSHSLPTTSMTSSPLLSQSYLLPACSTPLRWPRRCTRQLLRQGSDDQIGGFKSPCSFSALEELRFFPSWGDDSTKGSIGGSSDGFSVPVFSELMAPYGERWSFDSEPFSINHEKITRFSGKISSPSADLQTCGVCTKLLYEKSTWSTQKIFATNDHSVVAILICGHVYHAECLERTTPEVDKYDPSCPVCTFGEKQTLILSEKALKGELEWKRNQKSRNHVVDSDLDCDPLAFDHLKETYKVKIRWFDPTSNSSKKFSFARPFLKRHLSFGSKGSRTLSTNQSAKKKGFFWGKSSKE